MPNTNHEQRREAIRQLLLKTPAETQGSLVAILSSKGFEATQSSVSRDLRELGAIKTPAGYELPAGDYRRRCNIGRRGPASQHAGRRPQPAGGENGRRCRPAGRARIRSLQLAGSDRQYRRRRHRFRRDRIGYRTEKSNQQDRALCSFLNTPGEFIESGSLTHHFGIFRRFGYLLLRALVKRNLWSRRHYGLCRYGWHRCRGGCRTQRALTRAGCHRTCAG